jgi:hypothetical protein
MGFGGDYTAGERRELHELRVVPRVTVSMASVIALGLAIRGDVAEEVVLRCSTTAACLSPIHCIFH